jgi:lipopolysaccharide cholinephosphotransferase
MSSIKALSEEELRHMQKLEVEMMCELDRVCRLHDINYVIYGGTLLGAVRHQGFIPWDDDMDVAMLREDFEKFKKYTSELNPDICFFQDHDTDSEYIWGHAKLRRTGTRFVRAGQEHLKYKDGVFIDVIPMDDVPKSLLGQIIMDFDCFLLRKILWSRVAVKNEKGFKKLVYSALHLVPVEYVFKRYKSYHKKSKNSNPNNIRILSLPSLGKFYVKTNPFSQKFSWPKKWILERKEYDFDGEKFYGSLDADGFLKYEYNDYMMLPPEEKRHPQVLVSDYKF